MNTLKPWQRTPFLQVYPFTHKDTNDDGIGNLRGITEDIPLVAELGFKHIHISPPYISPGNDGGYDVAHYLKANPKLGETPQTADADLAELIQTAKAYGVNVVLDFVFNHCSIDHPAFQRAFHHPESKLRDFFVFQRGKGENVPPNNWVSLFNTPAWTQTPDGMWYLHKFDKTQPDINMWNKRVQKILFHTMERWLQRGIQGFRLDVLDHIFHDPTFRDMSENNAHDPGKEAPMDRLLWKERYIIKSAIYEFVEQIKALLQEYDGYAFGEVISSDLDHVKEISERGIIPLNACLLETTLENGNVKRNTWKSRGVTGKDFQEVIDNYYKSLPEGAVPNWLADNHDQTETLATRIGREKMRAFTLMQHTLGGIPIIFFPDLIGMENAPIPSHRMRDPQGMPDRLGPDWSRDFSRMPVPRNPAKKNMGYSEVEESELYLPIGKSGADGTLEEQISNPDSLMQLHQRLNRLREKSPALSYGGYKSISRDNLPDNVYIYMRQTEVQQIIVGVNYSAQPFVLPTTDKRSRLLLSTVPGKEERVGVLSEIRLERYEGRIMEIV